MYAALIDVSCCLGRVFEASLINLNTLSVQHWSYQLRSSLGKEIDWNNSVTLEDEAEEESDGDIDPSQMRPILNHSAARYKFIFSSGKESCKTLENILEGRKIFNLEHFACPNADQLNHSPGTECIRHTETNEAEHCSKSRAHRLVSWCMKNKFNFNLYEYSARLETFKNWSSSFNKTPEELAYFGFIHAISEHNEGQINQSTQAEIDDNAMCVYCGVEIHMWRPDDHPLLEHKRVDRHCMHFQPL